MVAACDVRRHQHRRPDRAGRPPAGRPLSGIRPVAQRREAIGRATAFWASDHCRRGPGGLEAFSHARSVDHNVVICDAPGSIAAALEALRGVGQPGLVMLAGEALAEAQELVEAAWVCVGAMPLLTLDLTTRPRVEPAGSSIRRVGPDELAGAQALVGSVFGFDDVAAAAALPAGATTASGRAVWVLEDDHGRVVSCLGAIAVDGCLVVWSMATALDRQRRGHGAALLREVLARATDDGCTEGLLLASGAGLPLYRSLGYAEVDHWQLWSRPRWVLGRS